MKQPFVIILSGPPAVGKSTVAQRLCCEFPLRVANIDLDRVKQFVQNAPSSDFFLDLASEVGQSMLPCYFKAQISVVVHKAFCSFQFVKPFIEICERSGVNYAYFKLTASLEELLVRNRARPHPSQEEDVRRIYDLDRRCSHPQGITIDTMRTGVDGELGQIVEHIQGIISSSTDRKSESESE
jgi:tRNA uridine 5-carbamoylmethylation protein Kti12